MQAVAEYLTEFTFFSHLKPKNMSTETKGSPLPGAVKTNSQTTAQGPDMQIRTATIAKGGSIPLHVHPFGQSHVVVKGEGFYLDGDKKVPVKAGFTNYAAAGDVHGWENPGSDELVFVSSSSGSGVWEEANNTYHIKYQS
jgi:quercetin dioxygenase-like cupin family protein